MVLVDLLSLIIYCLHYLYFCTMIIAEMKQGNKKNYFFIQNAFIGALFLIIFQVGMMCEAKAANETQYSQSGFYMGMGVGYQRTIYSASAPYSLDDFVMKVGDPVLKLEVSNGSSPTMEKGNIASDIHVGYWASPREGFFIGAEGFLNLAPYRTMKRVHYRGQYQHLNAKVVPHVIVDAEYVVSVDQELDVAFQGGLSLVLGYHWNDRFAFYGMIGPVWQCYLYQPTFYDEVGDSDIAPSVHKGSIGVRPALGVRYQMTEKMSLGMECSYTFMKKIKFSDTDPLDGRNHRFTVLPKMFTAMLTLNYHF